MKIAMIGGGSYLWALGFCRQLVRSDPLGGAEVWLMDLNVEALALVHKAAGILNAARGDPVRLEQTAELEPALDGADYVIVSITTGGLDAMEHDLAIPERYGIRHTVGDTVGPGGWARALRNIPVFYDLAERMRALCPDAWMINVTNPLTPLTRTPWRCSGIKTLGICPGVDEQARVLARIAGCPPDRELDYTVTGIDHGSWFTRLSAGGCDVLAELKARGFCRSDDTFPGEAPGEEPPPDHKHIRAAFAVWREVGYLPSIGDSHIVENFPWFVSQPEGELPYRLQCTSVEERRRRRDKRRRGIEDFVRQAEAGGMKELGHGDDPVVRVIEALRGFRSFVYGANYRNIGQIPGLPQDAVVETRARFDGSGVHPFVSPMPDVVKCLTLPIVLRQEMIVDIALSGTFDELTALVLTDPLCSRMPIARCRDMVRELVEANRPWIRNERLLV